MKLLVSTVFSLGGSLICYQRNALNLHVFWATKVVRLPIWYSKMQNAQFGGTLKLLPNMKPPLNETH